MKKWVALISVVSKPGHRKTLVNTFDAVRSMIDLSADFPAAALSFSVGEVEVNEKQASRILTLFPPQENREPSALKQIQKLCRTYSWSVPPDLQSVQAVTKDCFLARFSTGGNKV